LDDDSENEGNEDKELECYKDKEPECDEDNMRIDEFLNIMRKAFTNNDTKNNTVKKEDPIKSFRNI
uniref:Acidic phosphoprotein PCEMA1 n=1 Tax=Strongyloides papillosus TaxID=174720 RepID=A0A0N5CDW3_STREA